jgi:hypothetical protein
VRVDDATPNEWQNRAAESKGTLGFGLAWFEVFEDRWYDRDERVPLGAAVHSYGTFVPSDAIEVTGAYDHPFEEPTSQSTGRQREEDPMVWRRSLWLTAVVLALLVAPIAYAQVSTASLNGTVTDESKAVVPGVTLTVTDLATGRNFETVTNAAGAYRIVNLTPGKYKVHVELSGFATIEIPTLQLLVGQTATLDFTMKVGGLNESVTVSGETALVDTRSSQVAGNVDSRELQSLPLSGRNWMALTMLVKGITANDVSTNPGVSRDEMFQLNVDGQQVTQKTAQARYGTPKFSEESIAEFQIVTGLFDITQGRSTGIQVQAITKSGSNIFSGSAFGFFRDSKFNAPDHILNYVLPYSDKQLGGSLGGPIIKDKLHFFGTFEYEKEPSTAVSTPVYLPGEVFAFPTQNTYKEYLGKIDYQADPKDHVSFRVARNTLDNPFASTAGNVFPSVASIQNQHSTSVLGLWSRVMSDRLTSETRIGYSSFTFSNQSPSYMYGQMTYAFPGISIGGASNQPNANWTATYTVREDVNWLRGNHNFKIGGEFLRVHDRGYWYAQAFGIMYFNSRPPDLVQRFPASAWNNPAAWNLTGLDSYVQRLDINFRPSWNEDMPRPEVGVWFGDTWRVNDRLTLNYGVRWDADFGVANPPCVGASGDVGPCPTSTILINNGVINADVGYKPGHTDLSNVAPRGGFAWKPLGTDDFVIRGGTGLYFGVPNSNLMYIKELWSSMVSASIVYHGQPNFVLNPLQGYTGQDFLSGTAPLPAQTKVIEDPHYKNPVTWQYSIGFQKQLGPTMAFDSDLIGWQMYRDERNNDVNLFYDPTTGYNKDPRIYGRPNPAYGQVILVTGSGRRDYLALANSFTRRLKDHFSAGVTYTLMFYQHDDDLPSSGATGSYYSNPFCSSCEWGTSTDLQRNTVRAQAVYNLPWGFSVSGLYLYGSGARFATTLSSLGYDGATSGYNRINLGAPITIPAAVAGRFDGPSVIPTGGVVPRDALQGLPLQRLDFRLSKDFKLHNTVKLSLMAEVFNVTNHANYGSYNGTVDSATFGQPLAVYSFSGLGTAYVSRMGQLAFRLSF